MGARKGVRVRGEVDRAQKTAFLQTVDVFSVPAVYEEPKGLFLLEALANGIPVVQPRRGAFPEIVNKTGGGMIVPAGDPAALADAYLDLWRNPEKAFALGRAGRRRSRTLRRRCHGRGGGAGLPVPRRDALNGGRPC